MLKYALLFAMVGSAVAYADDVTVTTPGTTQPASNGSPQPTTTGTAQPANNAGTTQPAGNGGTPAPGTSGTPTTTVVTPPATPQAVPDSMFTSVTFFGDATLASGKLTNDDGKNVGSGGLGANAQTKHLDLTAVFSFGSEADHDSPSTAADYVTFLQTPNSALGGWVSARWLGAPSQKAPGFFLGGSVMTRANHQEFSVMSSSGGLVKKNINLVSINLSIATSVTLSESSNIHWISEVGGALRFWNKPSDELLDAIDRAGSGHVFAGLRVMSAFTVKQIYIGVELTKLGGTGLDDYKEFTILPYVGLRTGFAEVENKAATPAAVAPGARTEPAEKGPDFTPYL